MEHGTLHNIPEHSGTWNNYYNYEKNMRNQIIKIKLKKYKLLSFRKIKNTKQNRTKNITKLKGENKMSEGSQYKSNPFLSVT